MKQGWVYLMANRYRGKTYLGVTSNLPQRVYQHEQGHFDGYSKENDCAMLVWYEHFENLHDARLQEARMKSWHRPWKIRLIEKTNPKWLDLTLTLSQ